MTEPSEYEFAEIERLTEMVAHMEIESLVMQANRLTRELVSVCDALARRGVDAPELKIHVEAAAESAARLRKAL